MIPDLKVPAIGDVTVITHEGSIKLGTFGEITFCLSQHAAKATASDRLSLFHMISQQHEKHDKKTESVENRMLETESIDLSAFADGSVRQIPAKPENDKAGDDDPVEAALEEGEPPAKSLEKSKAKSQLGRRTRPRHSRPAKFCRSTCRVVTILTSVLSVAAGQSSTLPAPI